MDVYMIENIDSPPLEIEERDSPKQKINKNHEAMVAKISEKFLTGWFLQELLKKHFTPNFHNHSN